MADFTGSAATFPSGNTVDAYLAWKLVPTPPKGAPTGTPAASAIAAANGSVTFTGLAAGESYYAYSLVGSEHRYVRFTTDAADAAASAQVIEVAGLGIPSGTNWSTGRRLGELSLPIDAAFVFSMFIELETPPSETVSLVLKQAGTQFAIATVGLTDYFQWGDVGGNGSAANLFGADTTAPPEDLTLTLDLVTGPTTTDITVVRARAALVVI